MKQNNQYVVTVFLSLHVVLMVLLGVPCSCVDEYYELCVTQRCLSGPNISYPFRIPTDTNSYCGYPGFELNCSSFGDPLLRLHDQDYVVEDISYETNTVRLFNVDIYSPRNDGCFPDIRNYSLGTSLLALRQDRKYTYLHFLSKCNMSVEGMVSDIERYEIGCGKEKHGLVMYGEDENLEKALEVCQMNVIAPVEDGGFDEKNVKDEYEDVMKKGFELSWLVSDCRECRASGGRCGYNVSTFRFECFCTDRPHSATCLLVSRFSIKKGLILGSVLGGTILIICGIVFIIWRQKKENEDGKYLHSRKSLTHCWEIESSDYQNIENFLRNHGSGSTPKRFKYYAIKQITRSFKEKLGQGGFGSVFKGYLDDKNPVAVKFLSTSKGTGEDFINEVASISNTSHVNIVKLLGFCFEYNKKALVYEYMPNGSLEKYIFSDKSVVDHQLGWPTLFKIAVGIARGLEYLHLFCATRMVHFDIKPHNVLLDENFCPKISDFGLAKLCNENKSMLSLSGVRGTIGYIAPEVVCRNFGGVSHKSDVYSFGMMILEMVGGRKNSDIECNDSSQVYFPHWIYAQLERNQEIVLPSIVNDVEKDSARKMIIVSLWCIQTDPSHRPTMTKVVEMLEGDLDTLQMPPRPYLFSSANSVVADSSLLH